MCVSIAIVTLQLASVFASDVVYGAILKANGVNTSKGITLADSGFFGRSVIVHLMTEQERLDALARHQYGGYLVIYYVSILGYCVVEKYC